MTLQHQELPWTWPLQLGNGVPMLRARTIITAIDSRGHEHQAELAPCPGVHPETLGDACRLWQSTCAPRLLSQSLVLNPWQWTRPYFGLIELPATPLRSVQTAVEQLLLSWAQSQSPEVFSLADTMTLEGSALLALQADRETSWQEFLQLWDQGFRIFKCKVGRLPALHEFNCLQRMTQHGQGLLQLRLDANRGMSSQDAAFWKNHSQGLPIVYWEEAAGFYPQALDETLWDSHETIPAALAWILKPSRLSLSHTVHLLQKAAAENIPCVLSNAFDSGLSLRCSAWIYAAFCKNPQPLGFGTARFLPDDAWQSESWGASQVLVPGTPFAMRENRG